jgi:hypothetical protein
VERDAVDDDLVHLAISRLHQRYADVVMRRAWDEMHLLALADAPFSFELPSGETLRFVGPEALGAFGAHATGSFSFYSYVPLTLVVEVEDPVHASGRFYSLEHGVDRTTGDWQEFFGQYDDRYVRDGGTWRFAQRSFRTLTTRSHPGAPAGNGSPDRTVEGEREVP